MATNDPFVSQMQARSSYSPPGFQSSAPGLHSTVYSPLSWGETASPQLSPRAAVIQPPLGPATRPDVIKQGYLMPLTEAKTTKQWQWFVLDNETLTVYTSAGGAGDPSKQWLVWIANDNIRRVKKAGPGITFSCVVANLPHGKSKVNRSLHLLADSDAEEHSWYEALWRATDGKRVMAREALQRSAVLEESLLNAAAHAETLEAQLAAKERECEELRRLLDQKTDELDSRDRDIRVRDSDYRSLREDLHAVREENRRLKANIYTHMEREHPPRLATAWDSAHM
mmetsp:Transcript_32885/g.75219  ORF Transcript_32885/g.75219 Transcript_32885/m.75219 type:complete len:283 (+) Transcript_32885:3-851(+)